MRKERIRGPKGIREQNKPKLPNHKIPGNQHFNFCNKRKEIPIAENLNKIKKRGEPQNTDKIKNSKELLIQSKLPRMKVPTRYTSSTPFKLLIFRPLTLLKSLNHHSPYLNPNQSKSSPTIP